MKRPKAAVRSKEPQFARFLPGPFVAIASATTLLLADMEPDSEVATRLRRGVFDGVPVDELLEFVTTFGLRHLPSLAIVRREEEGLRAIVRGSFSVRVRSSDSERLIEATTVRTWAEHAVDAFEDVELMSTGDLVEGVVPAAAIGWLRAEFSPVAKSDAEPTDRSLPRVAGAAMTSVVAPTPAASPSDAIENHTHIDPIAAGVAAVSSESAAVVEPEVSADAAIVEIAPEADVDPSATTMLVDDVIPSEATVIEMAEPTGSGTLAPPIGYAHPEDYDHLFGATRHITVEEAAVRLEETPDHAASSPPLVTSPLATVCEDQRAPLQPSVVLSATDHPKVVAPPASTPGMIDGVPAMIASPLPGGLHDHAGSPQMPSEGDHDGMTVSAAELARLTGRQPAGMAHSAVAPQGGPTVQAAYCAEQHPNPPTAGQCRICHQLMPTTTAITIPRPVLGVLRMSSGSNVSIDRPLIIGRSPKLSGQIGSEVPHLVTVPSPDQAVSRNHVEVRLDGWHVMVVDLNSMNGTTVRLVGQAPQKLTPGAPFPISVGAVVDMGGGVTCTFEAV
jgi:FHA domain